MIPGSDISKWQGKNIDYAKFAEKAKFVYVRAMFGGYSSAAACKDPYYARNVAGFKSAGTPSGAYCFGNYMTYPKRQAQWFAECVDGEWGDMPPMLDFEWFWTPYPKPLNCLVWIQQFMEECDRLSGKETIFYCNPGMIKYLMATTQKVIPDWLQARALSVAHYTTAEQPSIYGFPGWTFWQHSDKGNAAEYGITESKAIDLQWFNGDMGALQEFIYGKQPGGLVSEEADTPGEVVITIDEQVKRNTEQIAKLVAEVIELKRAGF